MYVILIMVCMLKEFNAYIVLVIALNVLIKIIANYVTSHTMFNKIRVVQYVISIMVESLLKTEFTVKIVQ